MYLRHSCAAFTLPLFVLACQAAHGAGPPCAIGDVVRAGALNYDAKIITHNRVKGFYKVRFVNGFTGTEEWLPAAGLKTCTGEAAPPVTEAYFFRRWGLFISGGGGGEAATAPPLTIRKDGTYTWVTEGKQAITGKWHVAAPGELKYGYEKRGLTLMLEQAKDGADWLVSRELQYSDALGDAIAIEHRKMGLVYSGYKK